MSTVTSSIVGHAAIGALIPWITSYISQQFIISTSAIWGVTAVVAALFGYTLSFGIGAAIHSDCNDSTLTNTALWSLVTPGLSVTVIALITLLPFLRTVVESVILQYIPGASQTFLIAAVASYYLMWCFAIGGVVSGYEAKVCDAAVAAK